MIEPLWKDVEFCEDGRAFYRGKEVPDSLALLTCHAKLLTENTKDPYGFRIRYSRRQGLKMFLGMRMNDVHGVHEPDNVLVSDFWREHQDFLTLPQNAPS